MDEKARSTHGSAPWPRHLYMRGYHSAPLFKGEVGKLHIDLHTAMAWHEGWFGKDCIRTKEKKQIDLRDAATRVLYTPLSTRGYENYWHTLDIAKENKHRKLASIFEMYCGAPKLMIWGTHEINSSDVVSFKDPAVIVDALVHCIDRTSGREAVHNPQADEALAKSKEEYKRASKMGNLSGRQALDWGWNSEERKRRKMNKTFRLCEISEISEAQMKSMETPFDVAGTEMEVEEDSDVDSE